MRARFSEILIADLWTFATDNPDALTIILYVLLVPRSDRLPEAPLTPVHFPVSVPRIGRTRSHSTRSAIGRSAVALPDMIPRSM